MPFTIFQDVPATVAPDAAVRLKIQALSDIYKAMQARLDGYRQSAGAVFLALVAAALTFDSAFVRIFFDKDMLAAAHADPWLVTAVSGGGGAVIVVVCIASLWILKQLSEYFAEMTSVVYKIDEANDVWTPDAWLQGTTLYPYKFRIDAANRHAHVVGRGGADQDLVGWHDPAIGHFRFLATVLLFVHMAFYGAIIWRVWHQ